MARLRWPFQEFWTFLIINGVSLVVALAFAVLCYVEESWFGVFFGGVWAGEALICLLSQYMTARYWRMAQRAFARDMEDISRTVEQRVYLGFVRGCERLKSEGYISGFETLEDFDEFMDKVARTRH